MAMSREAEIDSYILEGMGRTIYVQAYILWATEVDPPPEFAPGATWDDVVPDNRDTRAAQLQAAKDWAAGIAKLNHLSGRHPLAAVFLAHDDGGRHRGEATPGDRALGFGAALARACMGAGEPPTGARQWVLPAMRATLSEDGLELEWDDGDARSMGGDRFTPNPPGTELLLVTSDAHAHTALVRALKKLVRGAHFVVADNVGAAIADMEVHQIRWILSDVTLVGPRTGLDFFRWVQDNHPEMVDYFVFVTDDPRARSAHYRHIDKRAIDDAAVRRVMGGTRESLERELGTAAPPRPPRAEATAPSPARAPATPPSVAEIAQAVTDVLPSITEETDRHGRMRGRFGPDKVFIIAVWDALQADPRFESMTLTQFKRALVDANRMRLLDLARADARGYMNEEQLDASEIQDKGATFHFVIMKPSAAAPLRRRAAPPVFAMPIQEFAQTVRDAARTVPRGEIGPQGRAYGWFGDRKVFISALWRALQHDTRFHNWTLAQFKAALVQANRERALELARADLVAAMEPGEIGQSEINAEGAQFHFVVPSA